MDTTRAARYILLADGIGCLTAAMMVALSERAYDALDGSGWTRGRVVAALTASGGLMVAGTIRDRSTNDRALDRSLPLAAAVNTAWVTACTVALNGNPPAPAKALLAITAVLDGVAGLAQFSLWRVRNGDGAGMMAS